LGHRGKNIRRNCETEEVKTSLSSLKRGAEEKKNIKVLVFLATPGNK
jgi:hypothetical protein